MMSEDRKLAGALALAVKELLAWADTQHGTSWAYAASNNQPFSNATECLEWFESIHGEVKP